jgi:cbb3-type cytochrome oxidase maturation protein
MNMELLHILVPAGIVFLSGSAILAFYWAAKTGQFRDLAKGSTVIFDEDEPVGKTTESFPDRKRPARTPKL